MIGLLTRLEDPAHQDAIELPQLDSLFRLALASSSMAVMSPDSSPLARHARLIDDAWSAIAEGEMERGERDLAAARRLQAETIVLVLGEPASLVYASILNRTMKRASERLDGLDRRNPARVRLGRMLSTVRELETDARSAFASGDAIQSLDVASHAAGLVNALFRELASN
jgi:hypothetical protein